MAKVHIAAEIGGAMLKPIYFFPFPGDPDSDGYEAAIPDMEGTMFTGLGIVIQNRPCNSVLCMSEYLHGRMQTSIVGCFFDDTVHCI
ncbi:hypothetical protein EWM64_g10458 [Hericium alpestre]|uniref:Uncharacterized protein n=1 Tax=Hericium alpestre TaxID=135208 RepID=A0A4Y9ZGL5_9AGAM|nr:hypothetical protein EWM64_g10458 [Hericium alpestre]